MQQHNTKRHNTQEMNPLKISGHMSSGTKKINKSLPPFKVSTFEECGTSGKLFYSVLLVSHLYKAIRDSRGDRFQTELCVVTE